MPSDNNDANYRRMKGDREGGVVPERLQHAHSEPNVVFSVPMLL